MLNAAQKLSALLFQLIGAISLYTFNMHAHAGVDVETVVNASNVSTIHVLCSSAESGQVSAEPITTQAEGQYFATESLGPRVSLGYQAIDSAQPLIQPIGAAMVNSVNAHLTSSQHYALAATIYGKTPGKDSFQAQLYMGHAKSFHPGVAVSYELNKQSNFKNYRLKSSFRRAKSAAALTFSGAIEAESWLLEANISSGQTQTTKKYNCFTLGARRDLSSLANLGKQVKFSRILAQAVYQFVDSEAANLNSSHQVELALAFHSNGGAVLSLFSGLRGDTLSSLQAKNLQAKLEYTF